MPASSEHKGDLLVLLSQQSTLAQLSAARQHYLTSLIAESRLQSELAGMQTLTLPPETEDEALRDAITSDNAGAQRRVGRASIAG